jgi:hypothetical protein
MYPHVGDQLRRGHPVGMRRMRGFLVLGLVIAAVFTFWVSTTGSAQSSPLIGVHAPPGGFRLPKPTSVQTTPTGPKTTKPPSSPPTNPIPLPFKGNLSCSSGTCYAIATLVVRQFGTLRNVPLATFAQVFSSGQPIPLRFGLSQHSVNLLYGAAGAAGATGDPRCTATAVIAVVNGGGGTASASSAQVQATTVQVSINIG